MERRTRILAAIAAGSCLLALSPRTGAQSSAGHVLEEHTFNAGGNPTDGAAPGSAGHLLSLDSLGNSVAAGALSSASHDLDACFPAAYGPPGEVTHLLPGPTKDDLVWDPEPTVGSYSLYRGVISDLGGGTYGTCGQSGLTEAIASDADPVPAGGGFYYLVTAVNRLDEEGTKGSDSAGTPRANPDACP